MITSMRKELSPRPRRGRHEEMLTTRRLMITVYIYLTHSDMLKARIETRGSVSLMKLQVIHIILSLTFDTLAEAAARPQMVRVNLER